MRKAVAVPTEPYPTSGLVAKKETQVTSFLQKHPEYDGRGIRVAILDSGVDPATFGLTGKDKLVDIIDCTGNGDVPLKIVQPLPPAKEGDASEPDDIRLPALSGRVLRVSLSWANPTGVWRVGFKRAFELWPDELVDRSKRERAVEWKVKIANLVSEANEAVAKLDEVCKDNAEKAKRPETMMLKQDLKDRLEYLKNLKWEDPGPILDVVVWHDGNDWRSVIGGAEGEHAADIVPTFRHVTGQGEADAARKTDPQILDLRTKKPMADYAKERHYERFGKQDLLSYSVKFYMDEEIISVCVPQSTHASHVAAILGGHVPDQPDYSGIAPGIEIVSLKIGSNRYGGGEQTLAHMRALKAIVDTECDICNMSWGADIIWGLEDRGMFVSMLRDEVIKKRNVLFVVAAGNEGPALSTLDLPAVTSGLISVGAYQLPSMQTSGYAMLEQVPEGLYTWSSRGPTYDGAHMTVLAPGGAVVGVCPFGLQKTALGNGTSMAAPNACGSISLVLSALKAEGIPWTPARVHNALRITSKDVDDPQPVGLIQVEALLRYLVEHKDRFECDADYDVHITPPGCLAPDFSKSLSEREGLRGVYLREKEETSKVYEASCHIRPSFSSVKDTEKLLNIDLKLASVSSESWIQAPKHVSLPSEGHSFNIRVDPTSLPPGAHFAEIQAFDTLADRRLVFTVPVCVCKPEAVPDGTGWKTTLTTETGLLRRHFLAAPDGVTQAEIRVSADKPSTALQLWLQCVQVQPEGALNYDDTLFVLDFSEEEVITKTVPVVGGVTVELCLAQNWKCTAKADVRIEVAWHGFTLEIGRELKVIGGAEPVRLQVRSQIRPEQLKPSVSFDRLSKLLVPTTSKILPGTSRDALPDGTKLLQLTNTYAYTLSEKCKISLSLAFSRVFYDSGLCFITIVYDVHGQKVKGSASLNREFELEKGDYTIRVSVWHAEYSVLEMHKGLRVEILRPVPVEEEEEEGKPLSLTIFRDHLKALEGLEPEAGEEDEDYEEEEIVLGPGATQALVIGIELTGALDKLYESAETGNVLLGELSLGPEVASVDLEYILPPKASPDDKEGEDEEEESEKADEVASLQLTLLEDIKDEAVRQTFLQKLLADSPKHLATLRTYLKSLEGEKAPASAVIEAADAVLAQIDEDELAAHLAKQSKPTWEQTQADIRLHKEMEEKRAALNMAYARKVEAGLKEQGSSDALDKLFKKYRQFVEDPDKDQQYILISARIAFLHRRFGSALKATEKLLGDSLSKEKYKEVTDLERSCLAALGWRPLLEYQARWALVREPKDSP